MIKLEKVNDSNEVKVTIETVQPKQNISTLMHMVFGKGTPVTLAESLAMLNS